MNCSRIPTFPTSEWSGSEPAFSRHHDTRLLTMITSSVGFRSLAPSLRARIVAVLLALAGCASLTAEAAVTNILARGKTFAITQDQLDEAFINLRATMAVQGRDIPEAQRAVMEKQLLEKLVLTQILLGKATDADRTAAQEKVAKLIAAEKAKAKSQARFEAQVRAAGMSPEVFEKQLGERAICEEVLDREIRPKLGITPEKVRSFYDANPGNFRQPERIRLRQVVFSLRSPSGVELSETDRAEKKALASRLVERLRKGEDFATLARDFSDDPAGRERGGEYIFPVGRMVPEFELGISSLTTNTVSDVIVTPFGYHVVKVIERLPGEQIPFETVEPQIRTRMEIEATQALLPEYQKSLFAEAGVEFPQPTQKR